MYIDDFLLFVNQRSEIVDCYSIPSIQLIISKNTVIYIFFDLFSLVKF